MIAVALLALALWVPWGLYPPSDLSHTVFRVAVCLAATTVAIPRGRLVRWGLALWAAGIVWSAVGALDPWRALWSTHNRNEGAWQVAHYLVLVLVAAAAPRERLVRWLAVAALAAGAWGVAPFGWVNGRLAGSAGNPLYLAPLLVVGVWAAYRAGWGYVVPVLALAAALTGSKGVGVALVAAFGVWALRKAPTVALAGAVVLGAALWVFPVPASGLIRLELGRVALHGIAAAPLGWGAEGYPFVWDTFWRGATATGEVWHDRAHNVFLDRAIEWGVVGLAGWLAVILAAWRRAELPERMAIAAYLAYSATMFEMMWGGAAFAVLLGYTLRGRTCRVDRRVAWTVAAVALVVGALGFSQSWAASRAATLPEMEAAIEQVSPIGGDLVELYLKARQTPASLDWAEGQIEWYAPHRTQAAMLLVMWDRERCFGLRHVAPDRPDVRAICATKTP